MLNSLLLHYTVQTFRRHMRTSCSSTVRFQLDRGNKIKDENKHDNKNYI